MSATAFGLGWRRLRQLVFAVYALFALGAACTVWPETAAPWQIPGRLFTALGAASLMTAAAGGLVASKAKALPVHDPRRAVAHSLEIFGLGPFAGLFMGMAAASHDPARHLYAVAVYGTFAVLPFALPVAAAAATERLTSRTCKLRVPAYVLLLTTSSLGWSLILFLYASRLGTR